MAGKRSGPAVKQIICRRGEGRDGNNRRQSPFGAFQRATRTMVDAAFPRLK